MKITYDIMVNDQFRGQIHIFCNPLFPLRDWEVTDEAERKFPDIIGKKYKCVEGVRKPKE